MSNITEIELPSGATCRIDEDLLTVRAERDGVVKWWAYEDPARLDVALGWAAEFLGLSNLQSPDLQVLLEHADVR